MAATNATSDLSTLVLLIHFSPFRGLMEPRRYLKKPSANFQSRGSYRGNEPGAPLPAVLHCQITFSARSAWISAAPRPSSFSTSSVCSPRSGERLTSVGLSESLIGLPTERYLPRLG